MFLLFLNTNQMVFNLYFWQVCNLVWSKNVNELVSTHGYSQNQIIVWRYPTMSKVQNIFCDSACLLFSLILNKFYHLFFPFDSVGYSYGPYLQGSLSCHLSRWTGISVLLSPVPHSRLLSIYD